MFPFKNTASLSAVACAYGMHLESGVRPRPSRMDERSPEKKGTDFCQIGCSALFVPFLMKSPGFRLLVHSN